MGREEIREIVEIESYELPRPKGQGSKIKESGVKTKSKQGE